MFRVPKYTAYSDMLCITDYWSVSGHLYVLSLIEVLPSLVGVLRTHVKRYVMDFDVNIYYRTTGIHHGASKICLSTPEIVPSCRGCLVGAVTSDRFKSSSRPLCTT
jgi:hypothetical protein